MLLEITSSNALDTHIVHNRFAKVTLTISKGKTKLAVLMDGWIKQTHSQNSSTTPRNINENGNPSWINTFPSQVHSVIFTRNMCTSVLRVWTRSTLRLAKLLLSFPIQWQSVSMLRRHSSVSWTQWSLPLLKGVFASPRCGGILSYARLNTTLPRRDNDDDPTNLTPTSH